MIAPYMYKKILLIIFAISAGIFVYTYKPDFAHRFILTTKNFYEILPVVLFKQKLNTLESDLIPIDPNISQEVVGDKESTDSKQINTQASYNMGLYTQYNQINKENILAIINEERNKNKLRSLRFDYELGLSAQKKAEDMIEKGYFSHKTTDGKDFTYFIDYGGYEYIRVSENLARGDFDTSRDVVIAWMNSPLHKANIFDGIMTDTGIGIVFGSFQGVEQYMIVQHFGRPRGVCPLVDKTLEPEIRAINIQGKQLYTNIKEIQKQIDTILNNNPTSNDRETVKNLEKNLDTKINEYNSIVDTVQNLTTDYNNQVKAFNECNTSYYTP